MSWGSAPSWSAGAQFDGVEDTGDPPVPLPSMGGCQYRVPGTTGSETEHVFLMGTGINHTHRTNHTDPWREQLSYSTHTTTSSTHVNMIDTDSLVPPFWLIRTDLCSWSVHTPWLWSPTGMLAFVVHSVWTSSQYNIHAQALPPLKQWLAQTLGLSKCRSPTSQPGQLEVS